MCALFTQYGCRTQRGYYGEQHTRDSVRITNVCVYDTLRYVDTLRVTITEQTESEQSTDILFIPSGGTFNANTGVYTGVLGISTSEREKSLQNANITLTEELTKVKAERDSLADIICNNDVIVQEPEIIEVRRRNWYDKFTSAGFWTLATIDILILLAAIAIIFL